MLKAGREASYDLFAVSLRHVDGENERDRNRRLLGEFLRSDLGRHYPLLCCQLPYLFVPSTDYS